MSKTSYHSTREIKFRGSKSGLAIITAFRHAAGDDEFHCEEVDHGCVIIGRVSPNVTKNCIVKVSKASPYIHPEGRYSNLKIESHIFNVDIEFDGKSKSSKDADAEFEGFMRQIEDALELL